MTEALIITVVVLTVVLESDLGPHRRVTWFRLGRPLVTALVVVPFFVQGIGTSGAALTLEVTLTVAGVLLGFLATTQMQVYLSPRTGSPVTKAGVGYALVWVGVSALRLLFSYGSQHWFAASLAGWLGRHHVSPGSLTDALIFMALAMVLTRVGVMGRSAWRLTARQSAIPEA